MRDQHHHDGIHDLAILREIGVDLRAAAAREDERDAKAFVRARKRRYALRLGGASLAVSAIAVAMVLGPGIHDGAPKLDAVASAEAALSPDGQVVHLVMTGGPVQPNGKPLSTGLRKKGKVVAVLGERVEQWSASDPVRFKLTREVLTPDGKPLGTLESGQAADGTGWEARDWSRELRVDRNPAAGTEADLSGAEAPDAATAIARLLERGAFKDRGLSSVNGIRVRVLVATASGGSNGQGGYTADVQTRYFVNAETSEPVRLETYMRIPLHIGPGITPADRKRILSQNNDYVLSSRLDVDRYERVPLQQAPADLFKVPPAPGNGR